MPPRKKPPRKSSRAKPKQPALSLLILECDTPNLSPAWRQLGSDIYRSIQLLDSVEKAEVNSRDHFTKAFADYSKKYSSIKVVFVIGHANRAEIPLSQDKGVYYTWDEFAGWFTHYNPKHIVLAACEAGQLPSKEAFFRRIRGLKYLFASPLKLSRPQAEIMRLLIPYLLLNPTIDSDLVMAAQALAFFNTGAVILACKRRDSEWNNVLQIFSLLPSLVDSRH